MNKVIQERGYITITLLYIFSFLWLVWFGICMEAGKMEELVREEQSFIAVQYASEGGLSWFLTYANHLPLKERKELAQHRRRFTFPLGTATVKVFSKEAKIAPSYGHLLVSSQAIDHTKRYVAKNYAVYTLNDSGYWEMTFIGKGKKENW